MFELQAYGPALLFYAIAIGVGLGPLILGQFIRPNRPDGQKNSPYECGFPEFSDARSPFDVRFYLVAMLFIFCLTLKPLFLCLGQWSFVTLVGKAFGS